MGRGSRCYSGQAFDWLALGMQGVAALISDGEALLPLMSGVVCNVDGAQANARFYRFWTLFNEDNRTEGARMATRGQSHWRTSLPLLS